MKLTLQIQILPDAAADARLRAAVERFNEAASWLGGLAFEHKLRNKYRLQKLAYKDLRRRFGLPADMAIACIVKVCDLYKSDPSAAPTFRASDGIMFCPGKTISFKGPDRVSLGTLAGRVVVPYLARKYQAERFGPTIGQADLYVSGVGTWVLLVTVDVPDGTPIPRSDFVGVALGADGVVPPAPSRARSRRRTEQH